jgi:hypothetical protein
MAQSGTLVRSLQFRYPLIVCNLIGGDAFPLFRFRAELSSIVQEYNAAARHVHIKAAEPHNG